MRRLVLFDIDGTLISDGGASRSAFAASLASVYGYAGDVERYDFSGRTDPQIAEMVLKDAGIEAGEIAKLLPELWRVYLAGLEQNATPQRVRILPGIGTLLKALAGELDVMLALLTGNIEPGARLKLAPAALNVYFPFGAFGSDSAKREELPPIAIARAETAGRRHLNPEDVVIIGDSIYDVRCGAPHGATTIAIASGKTSADRLRAENPTHFFESAEALAPLLSAILG